MKINLVENQEPHGSTKIYRNLKRLAYLTGLAGILFSFNSCESVGYVVTQPTYRVYARPPQPTTTHIWIDGDWGYRRTNHSYIQKNGHWTKPKHGRTYESGRWQESPKGHSYTKGKWKK